MPTSSKIDTMDSVQSASSHEALVLSLRTIIENAQVSVQDLDQATAEMGPFLSASGQSEIHLRLAAGDLMAVRRSVLVGLSAATLLRMSSTPKAPQGLAWDLFLRAVLDAVDMVALEEVALRQLAFDVLICNLSDLESHENEPAPEEDAGDSVLSLLPTLSLPHFRVLQNQGRGFLGLA